MSVGGGAAPGSAPVVALDLARREREAAFRRERSRAECSLFVSWALASTACGAAPGAGAASACRLGQQGLPLSAAGAAGACV